MMISLPPIISIVKEASDQYFLPCNHYRIELATEGTQDIICNVTVVVYNGPMD
jgi:hypothetical protein